MMNLDDYLALTQAMVACLAEAAFMAAQHDGQGIISPVYSAPGEKVLVLLEQEDLIPKLQKILRGCSVSSVEEARVLKAVLDVKIAQL